MTYEYQQHEQAPLCEGWRRRLQREKLVPPRAPGLAPTAERGLWYLAAPYSKYRYGIEAAFELACEAAGELIRAGVPVFSPIAHSHSIAAVSGLDPLAHDIWMPADRPLMDAAVGIVVLTVDGWTESVGVDQERRVFAAAGKPCVYMVRGIVPLEFRT